MCHLFKLKINRESFITHCRDYIDLITPSPIGVEVGVLGGNFSFYILDVWKNIKLFSVDPWMNQIDTQYIDVNNRDNETFERMYLDVLKRSNNYSPRSIIVRILSTPASQMFEDNSLDFVYLDANHSYETVKEDLHHWYPKIKKNGIISGHDFIEDATRNVDGVPTCFGVQKAVKEFFNNQLVFHTDEEWSNWFHIK